MNRLESMPKHQMITNHFRKMILSGKIDAGERLSSDNEIASHFGVNKRTVAKGMSQLVADGLISRTPGRGSLVVRQKTVERNSNAIGVVSFNTDHVHSDIAAELTEGIIKHNFYPVWISQPIFRQAVSTPNYAPMSKMLEHFLNDCPHGMIIDGERFIPYDLLRRNRSKINNLVFIIHYMNKERIPAKYVLIDYKAAGKRAADYLFKKGHRKISFLCLPQKLQEGHEPTVQIITKNELCRRFRELGGEFVESIPDRLISGDSIRNVFEKELLCSGITALMSATDAYWVRDVAPIAASLGLEIPDDISIIGFYDTPWTTKYHLPLTSMNINQQKLARLAIKMLFGEIPDTEINIIPEIIERDSVKNLNK